MPQVLNLNLRRCVAIAVLSLINLGIGGVLAAASTNCPEESTLVGNICVTDLGDPEGEVVSIDESDPNQLITLRMAVQAINESATSSSPTPSIYFDLSLFQSGDQYVESTIVLSAPLELRSNIQIIGPTSPTSNLLLNIKRGSEMETGIALIIVNPDSAGVVDASNLANREVILENLRIDASADSMQVTTTSGRAIEVLPDGSESATTPILILSNSIIENAHVSTDENGDPSEGGAITTSGEVMVVDSTFQNNSVAGSGGAIFASETVSVTNSIFESNTALRLPGSTPEEVSGPQGGAIFSDGKVITGESEFSRNMAEEGGAISARSVEISQSIFVENEATLVVVDEPQWFGTGGAISIRSYGEASHVDEATFSGNTAGSGGAIAVNVMGDYVAPTSLEITNSNFIGNSAVASGDEARGGAIVAPFQVSVMISNESLFLDNHSDAHGGAISILGGNIDYAEEGMTSGLTVVNSEFAYNTASLDGGAIHIDQVFPMDSNIEFNVSISSQLSEGIPVPEEDLNSTVFAGNSAPRGGAIFTSAISGNFEVSKVDFYENQAIEGGAIYVEAPTIFDFIYEEDVESEWWWLFDFINADFASSWKDSEVRINSSSFTHNFAYEAGGAIHSDDDVIVDNSNFEDNRAFQSGGAISAQRVDITESTFTQNFACMPDFEDGFDSDPCVSSSGNNGGAIAIDMSVNEAFAEFLISYQMDPEIFGTLPEGLASLLVKTINSPSIITSSLFEENEAGSSGGGVWGYAWLFFNTFLNNRAETGSAISLEARPYWDMEAEPANRFSQSVGNFIYSTSNENSLCSVPFHFSFANELGDTSCSSLEPEFNPILNEEFEIEVDIDSVIIEPSEFGENPHPSTTLTSAFMSDMETQYRENFDDFLIHAIFSPGVGPGASLGLQVSLSSLVIDLVSFLTEDLPDHEDDAPPFNFDDTRLVPIIESIFGTVDQPAGIRIDLNGVRRPLEGCWTYGAIQSIYVRDCEIVNEFGSDSEDSLNTPRIERIPFGGSNSTWKPRVPTERDLARSARLAALKAKIIQIRETRKLKKSLKELARANKSLALSTEKLKQQRIRQFV